MSAALRTVLGLAPVDEQAIEDALYGGQLEVLGSGADGVELLELAAARAPELVLVSAGLPGLERALIDRLGRIGPHVAGLALDERGYRRLRELDIDPIVGLPLEVAALRSVISARGEDGVPAAAEHALAGSAPGSVGSVVAVVGSRGAPGATELAASFAAWVARSHEVMLADFDGDGGELALRFGVEAGAGSLLALARALDEGDSDLPRLLPHWVSAATRGWPAVLPGLLDAQRDLHEYPAAELGGRLARGLAHYAPLVVCDVGHRLRHSDGGDRAVALHRSTLSAADAVVVVIGARPDQLNAGEHQLDVLLGPLAVPPQVLRVVVNGQPAHPRPQAEPALAGFLAALSERDLALDAVLPYDGRARRSARRRCLPMAVAAPRGRYARGVRELCEALLVPSLPRPAARKRRLALGRIRGGAVSARGIEEVALPWRG